MAMITRCYSFIGMMAVRMRRPVSELWLSGVLWERALWMQLVLALSMSLATERRTSGNGYSPIMTERGVWNFN